MKARDGVGRRTLRSGQALPFRGGQRDLRTCSLVAAGGVYRPCARPIDPTPTPPLKGRGFSPQPVEKGPYIWIVSARPIWVGSGPEDPPHREALGRGAAAKRWWRGRGAALTFEVANPSVSPAGCHLPNASRWGGSVRPLPVGPRHSCHRHPGCGDGLAFSGFMVRHFLRRGFLFERRPWMLKQAQHDEN